MNIKTIGSIIVVLAAVAGFAYLKMDKTPADIVQEYAAPQPQASAPTESGKKIAFAEFIKQGGAYKCTVNQSVAGTDTVGTTYIHNGLIRGEYSTKTAGMNIATSLIVRDGFTYTWTSMAPTMGFKAKVVDNAVVNTGAAMSASYSWNAQQIGDYNCESWAADDSMFTVPASVTFKEI